MASFNNISDLDAHLRVVRGGFLQVAHRNLDDYPGMVLSILIRLNQKTETFELDLEWMCLGLDLYGDTLQESHIQSFTSLIELMEFLKYKYEIGLVDIPLKYQFDDNAFPNPVKNTQDRSVFEEAWKRFQVDFREQKIVF